MRDHTPSVRPDYYPNQIIIWLAVCGALNRRTLRGGGKSCIVFMVVFTSECGCFRVCLSGGKVGVTLGVGRNGHVTIHSNLRPSFLTFQSLSHHHALHGNLDTIRTQARRGLEGHNLRQDRRSEQRVSGFRKGIRKCVLALCSQVCRVARVGCLGYHKAHTPIFEICPARNPS